VIDTFICQVPDLPEGHVAEFETAGGALCVVRDGMQCFVFQARCPHQGVPLCDAHFEDGVLTCLEHLWQWNLREGGAPQGRAEVALGMVAVTRVGSELHAVPHGSAEARSGAEPVLRAAAG
jgi:toluene monooxygenase system ferredoxin subunit